MALFLKHILSPDCIHLSSCREVVGSVPIDDIILEAPCILLPVAEEQSPEPVPAVVVELPFVSDPIGVEIGEVGVIELFVEGCGVFVVEGSEALELALAPTARVPNLARRVVEDSIALHQPAASHFSFIETSVIEYYPLILFIQGWGFLLQVF